jgi:spiro-SPASM protein
MKCIAAIEVDLTTSTIGTRSRAADPIHGIPVLTRTLQKLAQADKLQHIYLICPSDQIKNSTQLVPTDLSNRVTVQPRKIENAPMRQLITVARKWSLESWRGGIGGTTCMDEYTRSDELALLAKQHNAEMLFNAPATAPLIDPIMINDMVDHAKRTVNDSRITFAQSPPGLTGTIYCIDFLFDMAHQHVSPGMVLSYKPDRPIMDLANKTCCFIAPAAVRHARGRLIVDTDRAFSAVQDFLATDQPTDAETISQWLIDRDTNTSTDHPHEVEIELTTESRIEKSTVRPTEKTVGHRGPIDLHVIQETARELARCDDSLVVLGGFGDPLLHPEFDAVLRILREAGVFGICVRTNALALDHDAVSSLITHQVDIVSALLDAWQPKTYETIHNQDRLETATKNMRTLIQHRTEQQSVAPIVIPEMIKSTDTMDDIDPFFDHWVREVGWATIAGYSNFAGQWPDRSEIDMAPPTRNRCVRLSRRTTILANGDMVVCEQDFRGEHPVGNLRDKTLGELWQSPSMTQCREKHRTSQFNATPLCHSCNDWQRP